MKNYLLIAFIILSSFVSIEAQQMTGQVVEILDQKSFTFQTTQTKFTVQLQYVDPPESSQPLQDVVKNHLSTMLKGKTVTVQFASLSGGRTIAKVYLSGVDVSVCSLLRDGAAWYSVPEARLQPAVERADYEQAESLAKSEKRGVWGLQNVKPAWELRLERAKLLKELEEKEWKEMLEKIAQVGVAREPVVGMSRAEFNYLCGREPGDRVSRYDTSQGFEFYETLIVTDKRKQTMCFGGFNFDRNQRLTSISRSASYVD